MSFDNDKNLLMRRQVLVGMATLPFIGSIVACGGGPEGGASVALSEQEGTPDQQAAPVPAGHPGLWHTTTDLQRMAAMVSANQEPWLAGYNVLLGGRRANLDATPYPLEVVIRGVDGADNYGVMVVDMMRAYHLALRWHISGDEAYARDAVRFLNAWSSTLKELGGNSNLYLSSGLYGAQWANAAELMRHYPGWAQEDQDRFKDMLLKVFYTRAHEFLTTHNGSETRKVTHYWANWDLANLCAAYAIGVFCDRPDITAFAVDYYKNGRGTGASAHHVFYLHPGHLGQWQETHRDQGHSTLGIALAGSLCEMAWNQGEDLYGYANNRLLAGAEYVARNNLNDPATMPFVPYTGVQGTGLAAAGTGARRPCWERIYHHYVSRRGLSAPWTKAMLDQTRPERIDGGDDPGMGTLLYTRSAVPASPPRGLTAFLNDGKVLLSWWGSADATHYLVQRSSSRNGPFTTIAQVTEPRTYTDTPAQGIWHYRISAVSPQGERVGVDVARVVTPGELWLHLPMNGNLDDASGNRRHAKWFGGTTFEAGRAGGNCVVLDGDTGYIALPDGAVSALGDFTVAVWVQVDTTAANTRIFDFGSDDVAYIALTPRSGEQKLHFLASRDQFWPAQPLFADPLPTGRWVHVAVTLAGTVGTLYVDGLPVASHNEVWMNPYQMGHTRQTWLGRSQYGGDRLFKGRMQDFRIYSGALPAAQVAALAQ